MPKRKSRSYGYVHEEPEHIPLKRKKIKERRTQKNRPSIDWKTPTRRLLVGLFFLLSIPFRFIFFLAKTSKKNGKSLGQVMFKFGLIGTVFGFIFLIGLFAWASRDLPDPDKLTDRKIAQSTKIYDNTGEHLLYEIFSDKKRTLVDLEDIPEYVVQGVIATEDTAFYEHKGIRPFSILRSFATGRAGGGASTLTQQLVKNAILTNEKSISRKVKEIILSIRLEQKYSKDQILKIYFNEIPYGSTNYGIESAAQAYFGKSVTELDLQESATLAGLPKAPTRYLNNSEALKLRRDFVLKRMYDEGFITEEEKNTAQEEPVTLERSVGDITAPHFVFYVKDQLVDMYGEQTVDTGGLKIITSIDWDMQQAAETAVKEESEKVFEDANANNTSLVAIDPNNGQILAMVGSRDFHDESIDGMFNVATLGQRQPGSSFKPIIYTAAFEKGYTPETILFDVETNFAASGKPYKPLNYDLQEHGPVTIRQALQGSLNIPAVKALYLVGEKKGVEFAERLGYSTLAAGNFGLSLVLGGGEVTPIEHVRAFSIFANGGTKYEPVSILQVEDPNGDILYEWKPKKGERVLDEDVAATISNVLSDDAARAYAFGTGGVLTLPDRPVAAKTGTTNNYVDAWTVGYTPNLVAGVWAGNTDNSPMTRGYGGSRVAGPIWKRFMQEALKEKPVASFPPPPEITTTKPALRGSEGGSVTLKVNKITGNRANSSTPENLIVERTYTQPHSILHYVQKDDPQGPIPEDPSVDPQYTIWEAAIQDWVKRKKEENPDWEIAFEEPPAEEDSEYALELIPSLEVIYPTPGAVLRSNRVDTDIRVSAPRGVDRVTYKIGSTYAGVEYNHPFNLNKDIQWLSSGTTTMTIIVQDDIGNRLEEVIPITIDLSTNEENSPQSAVDTVEEVLLDL